MSNATCRSHGPDLAPTAQYTPGLLFGVYTSTEAVGLVLFKMKIIVRGWELLQRGIKHRPNSSQPSYHHHVDSFCKVCEDEIWVSWRRPCSLPTLRYVDHVS